ncbi:MAG: outer membrane scaffolding protein for murein synthesis (MipA/OmpV family) [Alteromonadaceae bacterium]|jgi:outer membrane scaffolding protein for murein synthesis (MipA/OmpV family)
MRKLIILSLLTLSLQVAAKSNPVHSNINGAKVAGNDFGKSSNDTEQDDVNSDSFTRSSNGLAIFTDSKLNTWFWEQNNQNLQIKNIGADFQKEQYLYSDTTQTTDENTEQVNAAYINGRFSANTGYLTENNEAAKFFVQSSYVVFTNYKFNLTVTAKIEALDTERVQHYYGVISPNLHISDTNTNATLGLVGTYELSPKWTIIGSLTSTALADDIADSPLVEHKKYNMALIGTTYSF